MKHGKIGLEVYEGVVILRKLLTTYIIIASLQSKTLGKLINRILGSCLSILSLPGSPLRMHVESLDKPRNVNMRSQCLAW